MMPEWPHLSTVRGESISSTSSSAEGGAMHELGHAFGLPHEFLNDTSASAGRTVTREPDLISCSPPRASSRRL